MNVKSIYPGEYANYIVNDQGEVFTHDGPKLVKYPLPERAIRGSAGHPYGYIVDANSSLHMLTGDSPTFKKIADGVALVSAYWEYAVTTIKDGSLVVFKTGAVLATLPSPGPSPIVQISTGYYIIVRCENGDVFSYSWNTANRVWVSASIMKTLIPKKILLPGPATDITTSRSQFSAAIVDGVAWAWCDSFGSKYIGFTGASTPKHIPAPRPIVKIAATDITLHMITDDGDLYGMGDGAVGTVGDGTMSDKVRQAGNWDMAWFTFVPLTQNSPGRKFSDVFTSNSYDFRLMLKETNGTISTCGYGKGGLLMNGYMAIGDTATNDPYNISLCSVTTPHRIEIPELQKTVKTSELKVMVANKTYPPPEFEPEPIPEPRKVVALLYDDGTWENPEE